MENLDNGPWKIKYTKSVAFAKVEKSNLNKPPRCIQARSPEYNMEVGRYIKHAEHRIYRAIAKVYGDGPTVMKGYNSNQVANIIVGKMNSFAEPVAIGLDASKFDAHVSQSVLEWEHSIYYRMFSGDRKLKRLLKSQVFNKGTAQCYNGYLKFEVNGKRFSGDMNTALGNCIIMCGLVYAYSVSRGVKTKLVNNGDDCVVFMEKRDEAQFKEGLSEWFWEMGFKMTIEESVYDINKIEFCQMRPIWNGECYTMVRNIKTALMKDSLCTLPIPNEKFFKKWLYAVGECGLAICSGIPIMQSFYNAYLRSGGNNGGNLHNDNRMLCGTRFLAAGLKSINRDIVARSRDEVFCAWGITPDEQVAMEEYFDNYGITYNVPDDKTAEHSYHLINVI